MFGKKRCGNCGEKIEDKYNYCPYCQAPLKDISEQEDWGLLGKNDAIDPEEIRLPVGLNSLFNSLLKKMNKQMKDIESQSQREENITKKNGGISISISTSGNKPPEIKVRSFGNVPKFAGGEFENQEGGIQIRNKKEKVKLPASDSGKFAGLPKVEPKTSIRRLSNKITYEIKMPGVKSTKDLSIAQLENSIEIKALANSKVFHKIIPISLPINKYDLSKGILTLELDSKE
ncbi:MAG: hypothetical protein AABX79_01275 [Nanoarchaeota archaeon]